MPIIFKREVDSNSIMEKINIEHPKTKFLVELATSQDNKINDSITDVVVPADSFIKHVIYFSNYILQVCCSRRIFSNSYFFSEESINSNIQKFFKACSCFENANPTNYKYALFMNNKTKNG